MTRRKVGPIVIPPGAYPDKHEKRTADFLAQALGVRVEFIVPSRYHHTRTPDIVMQGVSWEIKSPVGKSPRTLENNLRGALAQSSSIILDLRRMDAKVPTEKLLRVIGRRFELSRKILHIIVITREQKLVDMHR